MVAGIRSLSRLAQTLPRTPFQHARSAETEASAVLKSDILTRMNDSHLSRAYTTATAEAEPLENEGLHAAEFEKIARDAKRLQHQTELSLFFSAASVASHFDAGSHLSGAQKRALAYILQHSPAMKNPLCADLLLQKIQQVLHG